ncbi:hypothetical protein CMQ_7267 [Grosmannia clavigera kw1407]|uniref:Uncharacterized protein n=1 Tax=Grosmannia clavigera (strain kw1407 / UAMH 11150) TaxID=655863 RepID=F0XPZ9_GROCL|nr:uncharacterized protein CMQ_7267 [Grosmannia clavigera kw1407]EFX00265.1 hypothetical protein CMQ_7267 [Grosmannia clavigera kw1407]
MCQSVTYKYQCGHKVTTLFRCSQGRKITKLAPGASAGFDPRAGTTLSFSRAVRALRPRSTHKGKKNSGAPVPCKRFESSIDEVCPDCEKEKENSGRSDEQLIDFFNNTGPGLSRNQGLHDLSLNDNSAMHNSEFEQSGLGAAFAETHAEMLDAELAQMLTGNTGIQNITGPMQPLYAAAFRF